ncbi:MAG: cytochrome c maturation protein CcmE [Pseudomonadota bacterium]
MTRTRKRRLMMVLLIVMGISTATAVAIVAMQDQLMFTVSPSEVAHQALSPERKFRLGGLVAQGSIEHSAENLDVQFCVHDGESSIPVVYTGILPDLFREGQGVIAHGYLRNGQFEAYEVLARHDETYVPPEVIRALEQSGHSMNGQSAPGSYQHNAEYLSNCFEHKELQNRSARRTPNSETPPIIWGGTKDKSHRYSQAAQGTRCECSSETHEGLGFAGSPAGLISSSCSHQTALAQAGSESPEQPASRPRRTLQRCLT